MATIKQFSPEGALEALTDAQVQLVVWFASMLVVSCWMVTLVTVVYFKIFVKPDRIPVAKITRDSQNNIYLEIMGWNVSNYNVDNALVLLQLRSLDIQQLRRLDTEALRVRGLDTENLGRLINMAGELMHEVRDNFSFPRFLCRL